MPTTMLLAMLHITISFGMVSGFIGSSIRSSSPLLKSQTCQLRRDITPRSARHSVSRLGFLGLRSAAKGSSSAVVSLNSDEEFVSALGEQRLMFVEFHGTHCRKCFAIMGKFGKLAERFSDPETVTFAQVACDKAGDIAQRVGVKKVPTFQVYLDGEKVDELVGEAAIPVVTKKIKNLVNQWVQQAGEISEGDVAAKRIIAEYNAVDEPASAAQPAETGLNAAGQEEGECGEDGCEIVW